MNILLVEWWKGQRAILFPSSSFFYSRFIFVFIFLFIIIYIFLRFILFIIPPIGRLK